MKLDEYQQSVVDCNTNAVVSAGAGSGKTTVLAARFLRLIEEGRADVSEILTLTFTRKASAEMYERIYGLLLKHRSGVNASKAVKEFEKASISTLDSFCSRIARDCSTLFGLPPGFRTDEDAVRKLAEETSLDFILNNKDNSFLREFIYINGFENVWKNFFVYISMNYLSIGKPHDFSLMLTTQMQTAQAELLKYYALIKSLVAEILSFDSTLKGVMGVQDQLRAFAPAPLPENGDYTDLKNNLALLNVGKPRGSSKKPEFIQTKELIDELKPAAAMMRDIIGTFEGRELLEGLFELTGRFQDELFARKRTSGLLGFQDVLTIAVEGLKRDTGLRKYYKSLFRYIMIDEFQDNNSMQKELLYLLSERDGVEGAGVPSAGDLNPGKLFFVGDEKQSIYLFRGADVSVFKQLSNELSESGGKALSLKRNYRSEPGLIEHFNSIFEYVMRDSSEAYQASFEALEARAAILPDPPQLQLLYKPYEKIQPADSLPAEESEAWSIAEYINKSVGQLDVSENRAVRKADFSDFAVLFRSGTNQKSYEKVFRAAGIPYTVHSIRSLFQESPVNDIYNLLQICIYPDDRSASAAFLRSPLINLSDLSVISFLLSGKPVFEEGQEECCRSSEDLRKYRRAAELHADVSARIDREPLAGIVTGLWHGSGYRYLILADPSLHGYLEYYDYLKELAVKADSEKQSAAEFLDYVRENLGEYRKVNDLKILGYSAGGVQMMPVHQSKGLEFPVVIIANAGNKGVNNLGRSTPAYISETAGLTFNLVDDQEGGAGGQRRNFFFSRGKEEAEAREEAELRRLFYVALTRAENHLVISGCHGKSNRKGEKSMLNMFLRAFGCAEDIEPADCPGLAPVIKLITNRRWSDGVTYRTGRADIERITEFYRDAKPRRLEVRSNEFTASGLNSIVSGEIAASVELRVEDALELSGLDAGLEALLAEQKLEADFGTLCHRLIEHKIKGPADDPEIFLRPIFGNITERDWQLLYNGAQRLAEGFFNSELWVSAGAADSFESELPFTAVRTLEGEEIFVKGVIDLCFETAEQVHVVDFKTDRRLIAGEYDTQMRIYIDAASAIYSKPVVCSLFYLRNGLEVKIL